MMGSTWQCRSGSPSSASNYPAGQGGAENAQGRVSHPLVYFGGLACHCTHVRRQQERWQLLSIQLKLFGGKWCRLA